VNIPVPAPWIAGKTKHHLITDAEAIPLAIGLTDSNRYDVTQLIPLMEVIPRIAGKAGRPVQRLEEVFADRAYYDFDPHREQLVRRGIEPVIAEHGNGLGVFRRVVEQITSWLYQFPHLRVRYEHRADIHLAPMTLACIAICHRYLNSALMLDAPIHLAIW
jgi:hypothetical protein